MSVKPIKRKPKCFSTLSKIVSSTVLNPLDGSKNIPILMSLSLKPCVIYLTMLLTAMKMEMSLRKPNWIEESILFSIRKVINPAYTVGPLS